MGQIYDFAIIGAGATGLSAARYVGTCQPKYNCNRRISPWRSGSFYRQIGKLSWYSGAHQWI